MKKIFFTLFALTSTVLFSQDILKIDTIHKNLTVQQTDSLITANTSNPNFVILDVRTAAEFNNSGGHIENAINLDYYSTAIFSATTDTMNHNKMYLVYCGSGTRSAKACDTMIKKHYVEVYNMLGGLTSWKTAGYPVVITTSIVENTISAKANTIFPNPVTETSIIETLGESRNSTLIIFDIYGRQIKKIFFNNKVNINHEDYSPGIYMYQVICKDKISGTGKFEIQ